MRKSAKSALPSSAKNPTASAPPDRRDHHGFRGLPPPATFDFEGLPDGSLLSEIEVAAILRVSTNTLGGWRRQGGHPLKWRALPNGFVRYTVGHVREFLASGKPRPPRGRPPAPKPPERRRASRRPRTADTAPAEPA